MQLISSFCNDIFLLVCEIVSNLLLLKFAPLASPVPEIVMLAYVSRRVRAQLRP